MLQSPCRRLQACPPRRACCACVLLRAVPGCPVRPTHAAEDGRARVCRAWSVCCRQHSLARAHVYSPVVAATAARLPVPNKADNVTACALPTRSRLARLRERLQRCLCPGRPHAGPASAGPAWRGRGLTRPARSLISGRSVLRRSTWRSRMRCRPALAARPRAPTCSSSRAAVRDGDARSRWRWCSAGRRSLLSRLNHG